MASESPISVDITIPCPPSFDASVWTLLPSNAKAAVVASLKKQEEFVRADVEKTVLDKTQLTNLLDHTLGGAGESKYAQQARELLRAATSDANSSFSTLSKLESIHKLVTERAKTASAKVKEQTKILISTATERQDQLLQIIEVNRVRQVASVARDIRLLKSSDLTMKESEKVARAALYYKDFETIKDCNNQMRQKLQMAKIERANILVETNNLERRLTLAVDYPATMVAYVQKLGRVRASALVPRVFKLGKAAVERILYMAAPNKASGTVKAVEKRAFGRFMVHLVDYWMGSSEVTEIVCKDWCEEFCPEARVARWTERKGLWKECLVTPGWDFQRWDKDKSSAKMTYSNDGKTLVGTGRWSWVRGPKFPTEGQFFYEIKIDKATKTSDFPYGVVDVVKVNFDTCTSSSSSSSGIVAVHKSYFSSGSCSLDCNGKSNIKTIQVKTGDTLRCEVDIDAEYIEWFTNGVSQGGFKNVNTSNLAPGISVYYKENQITLLRAGDGCPSKSGY